MALIAGAAMPALAGDIDHVIIAARDLDAASAELAARTGIETAFGGVHEDGHTANRLASLGPALYLEVLGPAPGAAPKGEGAELAKLRKPEAAGFALRVIDAEAAAQRFRAQGLKVSAIAPGGRTTPDGAVLRWKTFEVEAPEFCGFVPFFIEWGPGVAHPSMTAPKGGELEQLKITHPKAAALNAIFAKVGAPVTAVRSPKPLMAVTLKGPKGSATYVSEPACAP
jgi:hypothetical protein